MATLTLNVPDDLLPRVMTALRSLNSAQYAGMTDAQVAREALRFYLRQVLTAYEEDVAVAAVQAKRQQARDTAWTDSNRIG